MRAEGAMVDAEDLSAGTEEEKEEEEEEEEAGSSGDESVATTQSWTGLLDSLLECSEGFDVHEKTDDDLATDDETACGGRSNDAARASGDKRRAEESVARKGKRKRSGLDRAVTQNEAEGQSQGETRRAVVPLERSPHAQALEDGWDLELVVKKIQAINRGLNRFHEHVSPKYTPRERKTYGIEREYGGITGTLRPSGFATLVRVLCGVPVQGTSFYNRRLQYPEGGRLAERFRLKRGESVFCDIGSGTGRPSLYFGCLGLRASVGFDVDPMQVMMSCFGYNFVTRKCQGGSPLRAPVGFMHADVMRIHSLEPVTHAFAFIGYSKLVNRAALLAARTPTIKVLIAVTLHTSALTQTGLLDAEEDDELGRTPPDDGTRVLRLPPMQMPSGRSYQALLIPMTPERRQRVMETLSVDEASLCAMKMLGDGYNFTDRVEAALERPSGMDELISAQQQIACDRDRRDSHKTSSGQRPGPFAAKGSRPRRAASRKAIALSEGRVMQSLTMGDPRKALAQLLRIADSASEASTGASTDSFTTTPRQDGLTGGRQHDMSAVTCL